MTAHPGILRAVTHLDIGDDEIDQAVELIPKALACDADLEDVRASPGRPSNPRWQSRRA
jgi:hypothetical protein